jgi:cyclin-dependent kinase 7
VTALREVKLLRELRSPHLVRLLDVLPQRRGLALVMEYCEADLEQLVRDRSRVLSAGDVKAYLQVSGRRPPRRTAGWRPLMGAAQ